MPEKRKECFDYGKVYCCYFEFGDGAGHCGMQRKRKCSRAHHPQGQCIFHSGRYGYSRKRPQNLGPADESENVQTPNPWQECTSLEEAGKLAGFSFTAPESVDGYTERYIAAIENEIAQVIFSNSDEDDSTLYFRKGVGGDDISGDYNTYDVTEEQTIDGHTVLCKGNDGLIYTATWTDGTYSYAVMCNAGMSAEQLSVWVEALA